MRRVALALSLAVAVSLVLAASPAGATVATITTGVAANTSWGPTGSGANVAADVIWVQNSINVNSGVTLTILPGTIIKFSGGAYINVAGSVQAIGNSTTQIYITSIKDDTRGGDTNGDGSSTVPAASDWGGFTFASMLPDTSRLVFCNLAYGGYYQRGVLQFQAGISGAITDCSIIRSYTGVECIGNSSPVLVGTTIQTSTLTPLIVDFTSTPVLSNLAFSSGDNGYDAFGLRGGTLITTATLTKRGAQIGLNPIANVTYALLASLNINTPGSLTINPGVVIKPIAAYGLYVGAGGNLTMNGTPTDTITITSISDDNFGQPRDTNNNGSITAPHPGDWDRITFAQGATGSLQYCRLKFGTNYPYYGLVDMTNQSIGITNTLLSDASHGVVIHGVGSPNLNNDAINNMTSTPILMSVSATPTLGTISLQSNAITALGIIGEQIAVNAHLTQRTLGAFADITYYIMNGYLEMLNPAVLTIDPNVIVKFQFENSGLIIDGGMIANGTVSNPIVFTSERDDLWGNPPDTNGDGSATAPAIADWYFIHFTGTAISAQCQMTYCRVQYAGYEPYIPYPSAVWFTSCNPTIANSNVNKSVYGIRSDGNAQPIVGGADTVTSCSSSPLIMSVQSDPNYAASNIYMSNAINGIMLIAETLSGNALIKYRPTVTYPPPSTTVFAYLTSGTITVPTGVTLAIAPQVVMKVYSGSPAFAINGTLNAIGSDSGPGQIITTSYKDDSYGGDTNNDNSASSPAVGDWGTLYQFSSTSTSSVIRNCLFQFGGTGGPTTGVINTVSASPTIVRSTFMLDRTAMVFDGNSTSNVDTVSVLNFTETPISMSLIANPTFNHMTIQGTPANSYTAIGLLAETYGQNVHTVVRSLGTGVLSNMPYAPTGTIDIAFGATWTIDPGVVIKMGRYFVDPFGTFIQIDGALNANGTPTAPIVFTSMADDQFGGDTYLDGAASTPVFGQWNTLYFTSTSSPLLTVMNNVIIRFGGTPALRMTSVGPTFTNLTVSSCGEGIRIEGNAAPTFSTVNVDSCTLPVRMSLVSNPTFTNVLFQKDNITALGLINETIAQDLLWKIRSVSQRLNIPYYIDGTLGIGLGSTVTMQPGVMVKLWSGGTIDVNKGLVAIGKTQPESLIVFTSSRDDFYGGRTDTSSATTPANFNNWTAVQIEATALSANVRFHDCVFRYGGSGSTNGALRAINSTFAVDSCIFAYNGVGASIEGSANPSITGSSLYGNNYDAMVNNGTSFCTNATGNWWGAANGPNDSNAAADVCGAGATNAGSGDKVTNNINYASWATTGVQNPYLGDVSLNGVVTAYDASLILQKLAALISLTPLQTLLADVDNSGTISNPDASLVLQLVASVIPALPANHSSAQHAPPGALAAQAAVSRMEAGTFQVALGDVRRSGDEWLLPVMVTGTGSIYGAELELTGGAAASLASVDVAGGALMAYNAADGDDRIALAGATPLPAGELVTLHFPAGTSTKLDAPALVAARVNYQAISFAPATPIAPKLSFLGQPRPNPANGPMQISFTLGSSDAGARTQVDVLDLAGRRVRALAEGALTAGTHDLTWDLRDESGQTVRAGFYVIRARAGTFNSVRRLIVVR